MFVNVKLIITKNKKMKEFLAQFGIDLGFLLSGTFGGLLLVSKSNKKTLRDNLLAIVGGAASANYMTPLLIEWFKISQNTQFACAFLLGFTGLKGVEYCMDRFFNKELKQETDGNDMVQG